MNDPPTGPSFIEGCSITPKPPRINMPSASFSMPIFVQSSPVNGNTGNTGTPLNANNTAITYVYPH